MASVFSVLGGPLDGVFGVSISEVGLSSDTKISAVGDGIVAFVDGEEVMVGRAEFMEKYGIPIASDADDRRQTTRGGISIMYAAISGKLSAKFYIKYEIDRDFVATVKSLADYGAAAEIKTYDPNITEPLLSRLSALMRFRVGVASKKLSEQGKFAAPRLFSALVSKSSSRDLFSTILACMDYCRARVGLLRVCVVSALAGALASVLVSFFGLLWQVSSIYVFVYYILCLVPSIALILGRAQTDQ